MKPRTILINKKKYSYSFKQKARRLFMEKQGLEYFAEYEDLLKVCNPDPEKGVSVKGMTVFADLLGTAIQSEHPDFNYDADELVDFFLANEDELVVIAEQFMAAQEQPESKKSSGGPGGKSNGAKS